MFINELCYIFINELPRHHALKKPGLKAFKALKALKLGRYVLRGTTNNLLFLLH